MATLERQSLDARLLNVEQEAMENMILVRRVISLLDEKYGSTERALDAVDGGRGPIEGHPEASFSELYADAEKLAMEIDAAFDKVDDDVYRVTGDLTVRGTTKPVSIDFEYTGAAVDPFGNTRIGLEGRTTVNRKDFGLNWNAALDTGGVLVSEKVTLEFDVSAVKSEAA